MNEFKLLKIGVQLDRVTVTSQLPMAPMYPSCFEIVRPFQI